MIQCSREILRAAFRTNLGFFCFNGSLMPTKESSDLPRGKKEKRDNSEQTDQMLILWG